MATYLPDCDGGQDSELRRLSQVIARNPDYAEAHLNLGSLLASMRKLDEAIEHLSNALNSVCPCAPWVNSVRPTTLSKQRYRLIFNNPKRSEPFSKAATRANNRTRIISRLDGRLEFGQPCQRWRKIRPHHGSSPKSNL